MSFRLNNEARIYFQTIDNKSNTGKFGNIWDYYYHCLMVGFKYVKLGEEVSELVEFNKEFPKVYNQKYRIIALLISSEIKRQGINKKRSEEIRKLMTELLDKESTTILSKEGLNKMNKYADGGFRLINEKIPQPYELADFIQRYYEEFIKVDEICH